MIRRRSILSVPGHLKKMHLKALDSEADCIQFDLEDSVPISEKNNARNIISDTINNLLQDNKKFISIRLNNINSIYNYEEMLWLSSIIDKIDILTLPKINSASELIFVDKFISSLENSRNEKYTIQIDVSIETAYGIENIEEIADCSQRISALVFGIADYTQSVGGRSSSLSGHGEDEPERNKSRWGYAIGKIINTAKARGLFAIDAPYGNFKDDVALKINSEYSASIGYDAKWAIHPNQLQIINNAYAYSPKEIERANNIVKIYKEAERNGKGAVSYQGNMIDIATYNLSLKILKNNQ